MLPIIITLSSLRSVILTPSTFTYFPLLSHRLVELTLVQNIRKMNANGPSAWLLSDSIIW